MYMKQITLSILFLLSFCMTAVAQKSQVAKPVDPAWDKIAREQTGQLTQKYGLNADQAKQVYTVQLRMQRNLASIADLKTSNPAQYNTKLEGVQQGTLRSLRRTLQNKEQVATFDETKKSLRSKRNVLRKEMMGKNASAAEIEAAVLTLFEE